MSEDPFNLDRFVKAQVGDFEIALSELKRGRKESHWIWYIFPQIQGLGSSYTAEKYALAGLDEAKAYLAHPVLGPRLIEACQAILLVEGKSASAIMGYPDDLKLRSSMTIFSLAGSSHQEFQQVLDKYFDRELDSRTLELSHSG